MTRGNIELVADEPACPVRTAIVATLDQAASTGHVRLGKHPAKVGGRKHHRGQGRRFIRDLGAAVNRSWPVHTEARRDSAELLHEAVVTIGQTIETVVFVEGSRTIVDRVNDDEPATDASRIPDDEFERVHEQLSAQTTTLVFTAQCKAREENGQDLIRRPATNRARHVSSLDEMRRNQVVPGNCNRGLVDPDERARCAHGSGVERALAKPIVELRMTAIETTEIVRVAQLFTDERRGRRQRRENARSSRVTFTARFSSGIIRSSSSDANNRSK